MSAQGGERCKTCGELLNVNGNCVGILMKVPSSLQRHDIVPQYCAQCHSLLRNGKCSALERDPPFYVKRMHGLLPDAG